LLDIKISEVVFVQKYCSYFFIFHTSQRYEKLS
jgi:hypothetical protein